MEPKYDALDLQILGEFIGNAKQSYRELARKLKVHPNTLMQRIKRLGLVRVIQKYTVGVDYRKIGYDIHAVVLMKVRRGKVGDEDQLKNMSTLPEVEALYAVAGSYDVVCLIRAKDRDHLTQVLRRIQETTSILRSSNTMMMLYTYKGTTEFNPLSDGL